jgi:hypothetical protein
MLAALLSLVLLGGAQGASCAMHGLAEPQPHAMTAGSMAGHVGMAGMSHDGSTPDAPGHEGCCTCIGECTVVAPLVSAPSAATLLVALVAPEPSRALDAEPPRPPSVEPDRLLPFANGPPPSALV